MAVATNGVVWVANTAGNSAFAFTFTGGTLSNTATYPASTYSLSAPSAVAVDSQGNAFFNQSWMVISNHCEKGAYSTHTDYYGGSQIVDPCGKVVAYLADEEGLVIHTADLQQEILKSRTEAFFGLNLLQDRRPEHYGAVVDQSYRYPSAARPLGRGAAKSATPQPLHIARSAAAE